MSNDIKTADDMRRLLAPAIRDAVMSGSYDSGFEVWHTETEPGSMEVIVHDFTVEEEDGTKWRGEFKLAITDIEAFVDDDDDEGIE